MTMHLLGPQFNDIGTGKRKLNAKQQRAKAEHEAWLKKQGLHPEQLASRQNHTPKKLKRVVSPDKSGPQCSNGFAPGGAKRSVFDSQWQRRYENDPEMAEREQEALARAEARKANLMPLYNKGPVQLNTGLAMTDLGRRR